MIACRCRGAGFGDVLGCEVRSTHYLTLPECVELLLEVKSLGTDLLVGRFGGTFGIPPHGQAA